MEKAKNLTSLNIELIDGQKKEIMILEPSITEFRKKGYIRNLLKSISEVSQIGGIKNIKRIESSRFILIQNKSIDDAVFYFDIFFCNGDIRIFPNGYLQIKKNKKNKEDNKNNENKENKKKYKYQERYEKKYRNK